MDNNTQYSTLCEQGDMGLWATPLNEKDNNTYNEAVAAQNNATQQPINEKKDVIH